MVTFFFYSLCCSQWPFRLKTNKSFLYWYWSFMFGKHRSPPMLKMICLQWWRCPPLISFLSPRMCHWLHFHGTLHPFYLFILLYTALYSETWLRFLAFILVLFCSVYVAVVVVYHELQCLLRTTLITYLWPIFSTLLLFRILTDDLILSNFGWYEHSLLKSL